MSDRKGSGKGGRNAGFGTFRERQQSRAERGADELKTRVHSLFRKQGK